METITAAEAYAKVGEQAHEVTEMIDATGLPVGECTRQGDLYIWKVESKRDLYNMIRFEERGLIVECELGEETKNPQLAPGNTKGSRHCVQNLTGVTLYAPHESAGLLEGPTIIATQDFVVTHPEHADQRLGAGMFIVTHQLDAKRLDKVKD